ncbi:MAG TPA: FAD:protein FMN transferase [Longimicrobiales bacterium]|nr:FAD:protein FMN transferase [Longimicrobiales bacterium]
MIPRLPALLVLTTLGPTFPPPGADAWDHPDGVAGPGSTPTLATDARPGARVERLAYAMGTRVHVVVEAADSGGASAAAEAALREIERMDALLSTWDAASAIGRVNGAAVGAAERPGPELFGLVAEAVDWAERTGGAFDPRVGALVDAWDLRGEGRRPTPEALRAALRASGAGAFDLDRVAGTVTRLEPAAWLDTGAFGKGAALRAGGRLLEEAGVHRALVDLGGQLLVVDPRGDAPRMVEVAHPARRDSAVARVRLSGASAATTGTSERWVEVDGARLGHVLDPRTGLPVPAWGSVTVVSPDPLVADVLSTALFVLGPEAGLAWAHDRTGVGVLFLEEGDGGVHARWNPAMSRWLARAPVGPRPPNP